MKDGLEHLPATKKDVQDEVASLGWGILILFIFVGFAGGFIMWNLGGEIEEVRYAVETVRAILQTPTPTPQP